MPTGVHFSFFHNLNACVCSVQHAGNMTCLDVVAAIDSQATCTSVGGVYSAATCQLLTQPVCDQAQGGWQPRKRDSLEGGMDLLYVGLLQASAWSSLAVCL